MNADKIKQTIFGFLLVALEVLLHYMKIEMPAWFHISLLCAGGFFVSQSVMVGMFQAVAEFALKVLPWKKNGS